jgi:GGDEF domain-containing protein
MVAIDIEHFKLFNEWYGIAAGDLFLRAIAKELKTISQQLPGIY